MIGLLVDVRNRNDNRILRGQNFCGGQSRLPRPLLPESTTVQAWTHIDIVMQLPLLSQLFGHIVNLVCLLLFSPSHTLIFRLDSQESLSLVLLAKNLVQDIQ